MPCITKTPEPPYFAVIFTSIRTEGDKGYNQKAAAMVELVEKQEGFLGFESAREDLGITVSYWTNLTAIKNWKCNTEHMLAQQEGTKKWYKKFKIRICKVETDYELQRD